MSIYICILDKGEEESNEIYAWKNVKEIIEKHGPYKESYGT